MYLMRGLVWRGREWCWARSTLWRSGASCRTCAAARTSSTHTFGQCFYDFVGVEWEWELLCSLGFVEDKLDTVLKVLALNPKVSLVVHLREAMIGESSSRSWLYQISDAAPFELWRLSVAFSHTDSNQAGWKEMWNVQEQTDVIVLK